MVHLEGPIVDSLYDNMLISFDEPLKPTLPCLIEPSPSTHPHLFPYLFTDANPYLADIDVAKAAKAARMLLQRQDSQAEKGEFTQSLSPPEWWRRDSASPSPWPFGALSHHHPSYLHTAAHPRVARTDTDEHEGGRFAALVMQLVEKAREEKARLALGMSNARGGAEPLPPSAATGSAAVPAVGNNSTSNGADAPRSSVADSGVEMSSKLSADDRAPTHGHPVSPVPEEEKPVDGRDRSGSVAGDGTFTLPPPSSSVSSFVALSGTADFGDDLPQPHSRERNPRRPDSMSLMRHRQPVSRFRKRLLPASTAVPTRARRPQWQPFLLTRMPTVKARRRVLAWLHCPRPSTRAQFRRSTPRLTTRT